MQFDQAHSLIADGDMIAVHGRTGILARLTRFFCRSPVTHTGIARWMDGKPWVAELNGGKNHAIPLAQLADVDFDVHYPPVTDRGAILAAIDANLQVKVSYGLVALPVIGLLDWLRVKLFVHWRSILVCSGWTVKVYEDAGWGEHTRIVSPAGLAHQLPLKFQVRRTSGEGQRG